MKEGWIRSEIFNEKNDLRKDNKKNRGWDFGCRIGSEIVGWTNIC